MEDVLGLKRPVCLLKKDSPVGWISPATAVVAPSSLREEDQIHEFGEEGNMLRFDAVVQFMAKYVQLQFPWVRKAIATLDLSNAHPS